MEPLEVAISEEDLQALRWAQECLENPSFAARLSSVIGTPIETGLKVLPAQWYDRLHAMAELSMRKCLDIALFSLDKTRRGPARRSTHQLMVLGSGAVGGFFGPLAMLVELSFVTGLMLQSIADIAREQGEDLDSPEACLACVQVFALGGRTYEDDAAETGYYGLRLSLGLHFETVSGFPGLAELPFNVSMVWRKSGRNLNGCGRRKRNPGERSVLWKVGRSRSTGGGWIVKSRSGINLM